MAHSLEIGQFNELDVVALVEAGVLLGSGELELFLPSHLCPIGVDIGTTIDVFVYVDRDGAPQVTTRVPEAVVGEFAFLKCVNTTRAGAFLDWGAPKDLFVPPDQQTTLMVEGRSYVVAVVLDRKGEKIMGSARLSEHFDYDVDDVQPDAEVELLVHGHSDAGIQVVVDRRYRGLIHKSDVYKRLSVGDEVHGFVRQIRPDNRLDVALTRRGLGGIEDAQWQILSALKKEGGFLPLHDKSAPKEIERALGMSKKAFKRGVGGLYKARRIRLVEGGISLVGDEGADEDDRDEG
ncbi:MAG: S1-like domain-containing RNA-binding protein [Myxococcota bacterium]